MHADQVLYTSPDHIHERVQTTWSHVQPGDIFRDDDKGYWYVAEDVVCLGASVCVTPLEADTIDRPSDNKVQVIRRKK